MGITTGLGIGPYYSQCDMGYTGGGLTTAELNSLCGTVSTAWNSDLASLHQTGITLVSCEAIDLQNPSTVEGVAAVSHPGTRSGTYMGGSMSACVSFLPNRRYRGSRPKTFLNAGVESDLESSQKWGPSFTTEVETKWTAFIAALVSGAPSGVTLTQQKYVNYIGPPYTVKSNAGKTRSNSIGTPVSPPGVYNILSISCAQKLGSQRKRLGKPF